jgi:Flp pilus assembly protein TadG
MVRHRRRDESGSIAMEFVIVAPAIMLVIGFVVVAGRIVEARETVSNAAQDSSRIASISRTPAAAEANALAEADTDLSTSDIHCQTLQVTVDTSDFATPVGTPASVKVTVSCGLSFSYLGIPGLPGTHTEKFTFVSVIDRYREH